MFGLIYALFTGIAYTISGIKCNADDAWHQKQGKIREAQGKNPHHTYFDRKGVERDLTTSAIRHTVQDWDTEDVWLTDVRGNKLRNLSEEKRIRNLAEAKAKVDPDTIAIKYQTWTDKTTPLKSEKSLDNVGGDVYVNLETGETYFKRRFIWNDDYENLDGKIKPGCHIGIFYMDTEDARLVCPADEMKSTRENYASDKWASDSQMRSFIRHFNYKQKKGGFIESEYLRKVNPLKSLYCDYDEYKI